MSIFTISKSEVDKVKVFKKFLKKRENKQKGRPIPTRKIKVGATVFLWEKNG